MMMKTDVLSGINFINACTHYELNGKIIDYLPYEDNEKLKPVYKKIDGWDMNLMNLKDLTNAPDALHNYINWLEKVLDEELKLFLLVQTENKHFL